LDPLIFLIEMKALKTLMADCANKVSSTRRVDAALKAAHCKSASESCVTLCNEIVDRLRRCRLERDGLFFVDILKESNALKEERMRSVTDDLEAKIKQRILKRCIHNNCTNDTKSPLKVKRLDEFVKKKKNNLVKAEVINVVCKACEISQGEVN